MSKSDPDPVVFITYSTPGLYRELAAEMIKSAKTFGVSIVHYEEPPQERWRTAIYHKLTVIRRALADYPYANICWIDADAEFQAEPTLIYNIAPRYHIAAFVDYIIVAYTDSEKGEQMRGGQALYGGTLWLRQSPETQMILTLWEEENRVFNEHMDDNNLFHAIMRNGHNSWLYRLPPAYFWVPQYFGQRFPGAKPVVVQKCVGMGGNNKAKHKEAAFRPWVK